MQKIFKLLTNPYLGPVAVIAFFGLALALFYYPKLALENQQKQLTQNALSMIENVKDFRSYYTASVVSKLVDHDDVFINYDHLHNQSVLPLPATLIHDMSTIMPKEGTTMQMYSNYPFPNRSDRVLSQKQQDALTWLSKNPDDVYTAQFKRGDTPVFQVAVADRLVSKTCVECHNTRADSPKTNWKLGDVRGVLEVTIEYDPTFILTPDQTLFLLGILILTLVALGLHYGFLALYRTKEHQKNKTYLEEKIKEKTASLEASNKLLSEYKNAVDNTAIVSKTDKKGKITFVNDAFVKISGYATHELLGKNHNIVRHPDMPKEVFQQLWETILAKKIWQGQIKNRKKDGSSYYVQSTVVPILNNYDEIEEFLAIRLDVTDIVESNNKIRQADRAKSLFLANMSHEIRTPLNAIIGFAEVLGKSDSLDTKSRKFANIIETSAHSLLGIINDILDMSKIESGNFDISAEAVDLSYVCEHVTELFSQRAFEKKIVLHYDSDLLPACIKTDGVRLRQVLSNLISNAIKFTDENGAVYFETKTQTIDENEATITFIVKDTGIGIPEAKLQTIFDPFVQVDNESNKKYQGTGLGLNISYNIVKALGGHLQVKSVQGKGSEFFFTITVPVCNEMVSKKEISKAIAQNPTNFHANILVAEDNPANQELIKHILQSYGLNFTITSNGLEAFDAFQSNGFDLVLMDINMPMVDGVEALAMIRTYENDKNLPKTPIVALTANAIKGEKERLLEKGMDGYLSKPIQTDKLKEVLITYLPQKPIDSTPEETPSPSVSIDARKVAKNLGVTEKIATLLIAKFHEEIANDLDDLEYFITQNDVQSTVEKAHFIKNSTLNLGLDAISNLLQKLENKAISNDEKTAVFEQIRQMIASITMR
jgi:PAS domain S-box-containing protein